MFITIEGVSEIIRILSSKSNLEAASQLESDRPKKERLCALIRDETYCYCRFKLAAVKFKDGESWSPLI